MNVYEVTYKNSAKSKNVFTSVRFAKNINEKALVIDGAFVLSIRLVGEYVGEFCQILK